MENDIATAVACAKKIASEQGITVWYVAFVRLFSPSSSIEMQSTFSIVEVQEVQPNDLTYIHHEIIGTMFSEHPSCHMDAELKKYKKT